MHRLVDNILDERFSFAHVCTQVHFSLRKTKRMDKLRTVLSGVILTVKGKGTGLRKDVIKLLTILARFLSLMKRYSETSGTLVFVATLRASSTPRAASFSQSILHWISPSKLKATLRGRSKVMMVTRECLSFENQSRCSCYPA